MIGRLRVLTAELACTAWRLCERLFGEPPWDPDARRYREPLPVGFQVLYVPIHQLHMLTHRACKR